MSLAQHKHHRDAHAPGAPVGEQVSGQSVSLRGDTLSQPGTLTLLLGFLPAGSLACTFSFCIKLCGWHLAKLAATAATGRERMGPQPAAQRDVNNHPLQPPNGAHLLLKLTLACLFSPGTSAIHPGVRAAPSVVTSAPTGQWAALLGHVCAPLPRWGSSSVMLTSGTCFK